MARSVKISPARSLLQAVLVLVLASSTSAYNATGNENTTLNVWRPSANAYQAVSFTLNAGVTETTQMNSSGQDNSNVYIATEAIWLTDNEGEQAETQLRPRPNP
jgi:hypothetical protein